MTDSKAATAPAGFEQVGWYCDHRGGVRYDEKKRKCVRDKPHVEYHWKRGERKTRKNHNIIQALHSLDYHDPDVPPPCPHAVPIYREVSHE